MDLWGIRQVNDMICERCNIAMERIGLWEFQCPKCYYIENGGDDPAHTQEDH